MGSRIPFISHRAKALLGYDPELLQGDTEVARKIIHPEDLRRVPEALAASRRTLQPAVFELRMRHPSLGDRWWEVRMQPVSEERGILWHGYARDITEQRQAELGQRAAELVSRRSQTELQEVFEYGSGPLAELDVETDRLLRVNQDMARLCGRRVEELIGQPGRTLGLPLPDLDPADMPEHGSVEAEGPATGSSSPLRVRYTALPPTEGLGPRWLIAAKDLCSERELERLDTLRRELVRQLTAVTHQREALALGLRAALNACRLTAGAALMLVDEVGGVEATLRLGAVPVPLRPPPDHRIARMIRAGRSGTITLDSGPDGPQLGRVLALSTAGRPVGALLLAGSSVVVPLPAKDTLHAIAESVGEAVGRLQLELALQTREDQLRQAQKLEAIGRLAGGIAHDFNNILGSMVMNLDLLEDLVDGEEGRQSVYELRLDAQRAATMTGQLLSFSRRTPLSTAPIALDEAVAEAMPMLRRLSGRTHPLSFRAAGPLPRIIADAGRVQQVAMNLVVNARDAMPNGGPIELSTRLDEDPVRPDGARPGRACVVLGVRDHGVGMEPGTVARIFEPFFTTKSEGRGTGLGLATVHGIAVQHGGWVAVETQLGSGSTFQVYFPITDRASTPPPNSVPVIRGRRVLVVEDEPHIRTMVVRCLTKLGYVVIEAVDGASAMESVLQNAVDIVVAEQVLPGNRRGLDLLHQLRGRFPRLPGVLMSDYALDTELPERTELLVKPFGAAALTFAIEAGLHADPDVVSILEGRSVHRSR